MTGSRVATAVALVIACGACGDDAPSDSEPLTADEPAAVAAAVDLRADGCGPRVGFGTGSLIDSDLVVTVAHVVAGAESVEVIATSGDLSPADVVYFDPDLDLAMVRVEVPLGTPLAPRQEKAEAGESGILVLPRLVAGVMEVEVADVTVLRAANIHTTDIYLEDEVVRAGFEIEGLIDPGDSGAMVVLPGGGTGIVWARSNQRENRAWAVDLPPVALTADQRDRLQEPVDVGACRR